MTGSRSSCVLRTSCFPSKEYCPPLALFTTLWTLILNQSFPCTVGEGHDELRIQEAILFPKGWAELSEECCCGITSFPKATTLPDKLPDQHLNPKEAKNSDCILWESFQCPTDRTLKIILKRVKLPGSISCESDLQPAADSDRPEVANEDCTEFVVVDASTSETPIPIQVVCPPWRLRFPKIRPFKDPSRTLKLRKKLRSSQRISKLQEHVATKESEKMSSSSSTSGGQRKTSQKKEHVKLDKVENKVRKRVLTDHTYSITS
ncbi:hypothetical protein SKAU_G00130480 [Synaphobranchus kaupii]|uniref:Uncharacterized protein n=1 Tax=Synaphobranchus kaupii TaxID=118154 RepID=A0A9Q1J157_SYNKA|nr:hypothetical protein SKAU_G00130480 [Synaphobranchus kaupii]